MHMHSAVGKPDAVTPYISLSKSGQQTKELCLCLISQRFPSSRMLVVAHGRVQEGLIEGDITAPYQAYFRLE